MIFTLFTLFFVATQATNVTHDRAPQDYDMMTTETEAYGPEEDICTPQVKMAVDIYCKACAPYTSTGNCYKMLKDNGVPDFLAQSQCRLESTKDGDHVKHCSKTTYLRDDQEMVFIEIASYLFEDDTCLEEMKNKGGKFALCLLEGSSSIVFIVIMSMLLVIIVGSCVYVYVSDKS